MKSSIAFVALLATGSLASEQHAVAAPTSAKRPAHQLTSSDSSVRLRDLLSQIMRMQQLPQSTSRNLEIARLRAQLNQLLQQQKQLPTPPNRSMTPSERALRSRRGFRQLQPKGTFRLIHQNHK